VKSLFPLPVWVYAAYGATWLVHLVYLVILTRGYKRLRDEMDEARRED
jgi:CcmD family protein